MTEIHYGDRIAVVVVTYFSSATLRRCLDTLEKATTHDVDVLVVDNSWPDGKAAQQKAGVTGSELKESGSKGASGGELTEQAALEQIVGGRDNVTLLPTGGNLGFGKGANFGVVTLGPEFGWVVVANADLEWEPESVDALLAAAERWPKGGSFGPLIREPDGQVYPSARLLPSLGRGAAHATLGRVWPGNPWSQAYRQELSEPTERGVGWLSGSCQLFRREAWDAVAGFDPRYFMYFEDVDLGDRMGKAGWRNVYVPSAEVMHIGAGSTSRVATKMLAEHHRSAYRYLSDRHRGLAWKPLMVCVKFGLKVRLLLEKRRK